MTRKNEKRYPHTRPFLTTAVKEGHLVLRVRQATELGYAEVPPGGVFDISYPSSQFRRARTIAGATLANTITSGSSNICIFIEHDQDKATYASAVVPQGVRSTDTTTSQSTKPMIAAIYPLGHPDSNGHLARYFDIRKLTEGECLRLMDVSEQDIRTLVDSPLLSKSAIYKLAGNSIVVSCLYHIFRNIWLTEPEEPEIPMLFPEEVFRAPLPKCIRMVTLCSGYDSQLMALRRLVEEAQFQGYNTSCELLAWAEFDPDSKKPIDKQPAVIAHNLLSPGYSQCNLGDMTKINWQKFKDEHLPNLDDIDILTYSTPCQSISQAGKRAGISKGSGTRSAVLWYTEEAIRVLRPKFLLQENVKALCNKVNMPDFQEWQDVCTSLGYDNYWAVLNAKDFGVPQNRERVFMLSVRKDLDLPPYKFPKPFPLDKVVADLLDTDVDESYFIRPEGIIKFLQANEQPYKNCGVIYEKTDHFFKENEIMEIRMTNAKDQHTD